MNLTSAEYERITGQLPPPRRKRGEGAASIGKTRRIENRWEQEYADRLETLKLDGKITEYKPKALTFLLADDLRYTPDFMVISDGMIELHEVKGHRFAKNMQKFKVAKEYFPWFRWLMVTKDGAGEWVKIG